MRRGDDAWMLEERLISRRLFLEHIESSSCHLARLQPAKQRLLADDPPARAVDDPYSILAFREGRIADEPLRFIRERCVECDNILSSSFRMPGSGTPLLCCINFKTFRRQNIDANLFGRITEEYFQHDRFRNGRGARCKQSFFHVAGYPRLFHRRELLRKNSDHVSDKQLATCCAAKRSMPILSAVPLVS